MNEHDFEPVRGLPTALGAGERVLWRGAPGLRALLAHVFHLRLLAAYFGVLVLAAIAARWNAGATSHAVLSVGLFCAALSAFVLALTAAYAYGIARTTLYTLTNTRLVLRVGVALSMTVTVPLSCIDGASCRKRNGAAGYISMALARGHRVSWLLMWPHARLARGLRAELVLRALPDMERASRALAGALAAESGQAYAGLPKIEAAIPVRLPPETVMV